MPIGTRKYMPRRTKSTFGRAGGRAYVPARRKPSAPLKKLQEKLAKSNKQNSALRAKEKANFFSGSGIKPMASLTIIGGGALAGAAKIQQPVIMGFSTPLVVGAGLTAASMFMKDDQIAPILGALGAGMLASWVSDATAIKMIEMKSAATPAP